MILTDIEILKALDNKDIVIEPFRNEQLGINSYDVRLAKTIGFYTDYELDCKKQHHLELVEIPLDGYVLEPGILYLGAVEEYTETHNIVSFLDGKSSLARLGLTIHITASLSHLGSCNHWTLELTVVQPLRIYPSMPIGQLVFHKPYGKISKKYSATNASKYGQQVLPTASQMYKNFL